MPTRAQDASILEGAPMHATDAQAHAPTRGDIRHGSIAAAPGTVLEMAQSSAAGGSTAVIREASTAEAQRGQSADECTDTHTSEGTHQGAKAQAASGNGAFTHFNQSSAPPASNPAATSAAEPSQTFTVETTNASVDPSNAVAGATSDVSAQQSVSAQSEEAADEAAFVDASDGEHASADAEHAGEVSSLSPAQRQEMTAAAELLKATGNQLYVAKEYEAAAIKYNEAIDAAPPDAPEVAVYMANLAACHMGLKQYSHAADCCTSALAVNPVYVKALMRRSDAYEQLDNLEQALADAKLVLEVDSTSVWATKTVTKLQPLVQAKNEKLKDEMLGKLKDLGNSLLGKFGMNLDNFKAEKDPATGSYSIKFGK